MTKYVRLKIRPEDIQRRDRKPLTGEERPEKLVNRGGRTLRADETPDGYGALEPGDTFDAPRAWYHMRRHWPFLVRVESGATVGFSDIYADLRAAVKDESHRGIGRELKALGQPVPRSKSDRLEAARAFLESR